MSVNARALVFVAFCATVGALLAGTPVVSPVGNAHGGAPLAPPPPPFVRAVWTKSTSAQSEFANAVSLGFRVTMVDPDQAQVDKAKAAGSPQIMLWLGNYDDVKCRWRWDDATLTAKLHALASNPEIKYAFVADEPHSAASGGCASSPRQMRDRGALVKSILPNVKTLISENRTADFANLKAVSDVFVAISYPCNYGNASSGCESNLSNIQERLHALHAAGIPESQEWWAMVQSFGEPARRYYRMPTATELRHVLDKWETDTTLDGYMAYTWGDGCCGDDIGLKDAPDLWPTWQAENSALLGYPPPEPLLWESDQA
jgi:hypothetical protein